MNTSSLPQPAVTSGVFLTNLAAMNSGEVLNDIDDAMREATKAAQDAGAKAKVTLELTIVPNGEGAGGTPLFKLEAKIKLGLPQAPRTPSVFFADGDGNLTRRNPRQEEMKLTVTTGGSFIETPTSSTVSHAANQ